MQAGGPFHQSQIMFPDHQLTCQTTMRTMVRQQKCGVVQSSYAPLARAVRALDYVSTGWTTGKDEKADIPTAIKSVKNSRQS